MSKPNKSRPAPTQLGDEWRMGQIGLCADARKPESYDRLFAGVPNLTLQMQSFLNERRMRQERTRKFKAPSNYGHYVIVCRSPEQELFRETALPLRANRPQGRPT